MVCWYRAHGQQLRENPHRARRSATHVKRNITNRTEAFNGIVGKFHIECFFNINGEPNPAKPPKLQIIGKTRRREKGTALDESRLFDGEDNPVEDRIRKTRLHESAVPALPKQKPIKVICLKLQDAQLMAALLRYKRTP